MPLFYGSDVEGLAYLTVSDDDWAEWVVAVNAAAVKRGQDETAADDTS